LPSQFEIAAFIDKLCRVRKGSRAPLIEKDSFILGVAALSWVLLLLVELLMLMLLLLKVVVAARLVALEAKIDLLLQLLRLVSRHKLLRVLVRIRQLTAPFHV